MKKENEKNDELKQVKLWAWIIGIAIVVVFLLPVQIIGAGHRGVVFNIFSGVEQRVMDEGINWKFPIVEQVTVFEVRIQKDQIEAAAASMDLQDVTTEVAVNYHVDSMKVQLLFQEVGNNYKERVILPAIQEAIKANTAQYNAEEIITKRPELRDKIYAELKERLKPFYINLDAMAITNIEYSPEFSKAIEAKQVAEQNALKAERDLERVKLEAQQTLAMKTVEAEALKLQKEQVTPEVLQLRWIEKWNGVLPVYSLGNAMPLINIPEIK